MNLLRSAVAITVLFVVPNRSFALPEALAPATLSFSELVTLATVDPPPPELQAKLDHLLTTPFVHNGVTARPARDPQFLRVAEWNINRGEKEDSVLLALAHKDGYLQQARLNPKLDANQIPELSHQLAALQSADIVVLDEVDHGVKRTKYRDVARDVAGVLGMNYAYAVEFVELNRIYMSAKKSRSRAGRDGEGQNLGLDRNRYLGLEGSAILSRYPIQFARIVRLPQQYDWYHQEIQAISNIEKARRWTAERIFDEEIKRQIRRGGRMALVVDLQVPGSPTGIVTVVCPHLEDYCGPKGRRRQIGALLPQLAGIHNPVIVAGDMNTVGHNGRPLTPERALRRYVLNYKVWARQLFYFFLPIPAAGELIHAANYLKNLRDPTAFSVPLVLSNPSRKFFNDVRAFRFEDGTRFSFDGSRQRSFRHRGSTLADSNERARKGFSTTFGFNRTFGGLVGEYKIDWFFVKAEPAGTFKPEFGRTLPLVNSSLGERISDHAPIVVALPLIK